MTKCLKLNITLALATSVLIAASGSAFAGKSGGASGSASSDSKSSSSGPTSTGATTGHASGKRIHQPVRVTTPANTKTSKSKNLDRPELSEHIKNLESQQEEVRNKRQ